jgi:hypothetical protein
MGIIISYKNKDSSIKICVLVIFKLNQVLKAQPDSGMNASIMVFNSLSSAALRAPVL